MQSASTSSSQLLFQCPKCLQKVSIHDHNQIKQIELTQIVSKTNYGTAPCGQLLNLTQFDEHRKICTTCQGLGKKIKKADQTTYQKVEHQADENQETYACPFCEEPPFKRHALLQHMRAHANMAGICPVCAAPMGG